MFCKGFLNKYLDTSSDKKNYKNKDDVTKFIVKQKKQNMIPRKRRSLQTWKKVTLYSLSF